MQPKPVPEIQTYRRDEKAEVMGYSKWTSVESETEEGYSHWTDGDGKSKMRMPISEAMKLVKQRGLPAAQPATP